MESLQLLFLKKVLSIPQIIKTPRMDGKQMPLNAFQDGAFAIVIFKNNFNFSK